MLLNGGELDGKRYLKRETVALMTSDQIGRRPGSFMIPSIFRVPPVASSWLCRAHLVTPNTNWPLGEYRWDGAGGSFYFVDPVDEMLESSW